MKTILTFFLLFISTFVISQCECTDCSIFLPSQQTVASQLDISGATNNTLGSGGQYVCQVCIEMNHDAIDEIDMILIAPDGSSVDLILNTGLSSSQDMTFEICFVSCDQTANPDSGFSAVFDSSEPWQSGQTYDGTYYPSDGCLEDLTGDVNGEWELEVTDHVFLDDGTLFDWYLVFTDDSGIGCANAGDCDVDVSCLAEGGELATSPIELCEGDPGLNIDIDPEFPNNNEPPTADFDYSWVIVNADTDVIEDISSGSDLTGYEPGNYLLCGFSFFINDEPLIPTPDGSLTVDDIQDDIDDEVYCADFSDDCVEISIDEMYLPPDFDGPLEVCADEVNQYTILDYDPDIEYLITFTGSITFFSGSEDVYDIAWNAGPAQICVIIESACGDVETCIDVDIINSPTDLEIIGDLEPCPGATENYTFEPEAGPGESYQVTISSGTIISQTDSSAEILWPEEEGTQEICIELIGGTCEGVPFCEDVEVELDFELPDDLGTPDEICEDDSAIGLIEGNNSVIEYIWTVSNLDILSGQDTEEIEYIGMNPGMASVCLEIITACGNQGPFCEDLEVLAKPDPEIQEIDPTCDLTLTLISTADPDNEIIWTLEDGPGNVDIDETDEPIIDVTFDEPGIYQFQIDESNGLCSESDQIIVEILDDLFISEPIFECNLNNQYTVTFIISNGILPYFVNGTEISGDTYTSDFIDSEESFEFEVSDFLGCANTIEDEFTCPCVSDAGTMNQEIISICIADESFVEAEWENDGILDGNDLGLFYLHDGEDDELENIFAINEIGEFEYDISFPLNTILFISYVVGNQDGSIIDLDDECLSVSVGQPVIFFGIPEIDIDAQNKTCENNITISGTYDEDLLDIKFRQIAGPGISTFSDNAGLPNSITVSEQGIYEYELEIENEACSSSQLFQVEFAVPPIISNITEECTPTADNYTVSFTIEGGVPPFIINSLDTLNGNIYESELIPTGTPYNIIITDADGCISNSVTGIKLCDCISSSGFLDNIQISACISEDSIIIDSVVNNMLDSDDIGRYYIHSNPSDVLGSVVQINESNVINHIPSIFLDSVYYVAYLVGNNINDSIDVTDPCFDISNSQPFIFYSIPNVDAGTDQSLCENQLNLAASPENGNWTVLSSPVNANFSFEDINDPASLFDFSLSGDYALQWQTSNGSCINQDTVIITKNIDPIITNISTSCSDDLLTYDLMFNIENTESEVTVNGNTVMSGFQNGDLWIEENIDASAITEFEIINHLGCSYNFTSGPILCECNSTAGTTNGIEQNLCAFDSVDINISNLDFYVDQGDTLAYILHDGDENNIGNVLAISFGAPIAFDSSFDYDTPYYLSLVIANIDNGTIDLDDVCLQFTNGLPVTFTEDISVSINDQLNGCIGDSVEFEISSNIYPVTLSFSSNLGNQISQTFDGTANIVTVEVVSDSEVWNIEQIDNVCANLPMGSVEVIGQSPTTFVMLTDFEICNNPDFGSNIIIEDLFVGDIPNGEWIFDDLILNNNQFEFETLPPGDYMATYSNIGFDDLCEGMSQDITFTVIECNCAAFNNPDLSLCNSSDNINLSSLDEQGLFGTWQVNNINNLASPPEIINDEIDLTLASEGEYEIIFIITDANYPENCDQFDSFLLFIEDSKTSGNQVQIPRYCQGEDIEINLFDTIENEDEGGQWFFEGLLSTEVVNVQTLNVGENIFSYIFDDTSLCAGDSEEVIIQIDPNPEFEIVSYNVLCFGYDDGELSITITDGQEEEYECFINELIQESGKTITNLEPGIYEIKVNRGPCSSEIIIVEITEPPAVTVELGDDKEIEVNEEVVIQAILNIVESDVASITWTDLSGILNISTLELRSIFENDNAISIEIIDENGCVAFDQINIRVKEPEPEIVKIYIPNIFTLNALDSNNKFRLFNTSQVEMIKSFRIFDRWGNMVHELENISPDSEEASWDGYFNDKPAIQGVYVYIIELTYLDASSEIFAGDITLIR
ncbi:MAG: gliding motility-associated C-terminal domain-containing protein [Bacteroidia bacterium]|nr:gliding motility-associated C-terminal domain-containing protein [Bacteroidia bacterium]